MKHIWMETLGKKLDKVIKEYKYPPLGPNLFTSKVSAEWRSLLSGLPRSEQALQDLLTRRLLNSVIEEVEDKEHYLLFYVKMKHKGEHYLVQLRLEGLNWAIDGIYYVAEDRNRRFTWGVSIAAALILLIGALVIIQLWGGEPPADDDAFAGEKLPATESRAEELNPVDGIHNLWDDQLFIDVLDLIKVSAQNHGYVSLSEETLNSKIEERAHELLQAKVKKETDLHEKRTDLHTVEEQVSGDSDVTVEITIRPGSSSSEVSQQLAEEGLVRSEEEILQLIRALGADKKIRSGTHVISKEATYLELIELITHK